MDAAHEKLLDVRDAVHVVTGRGRDRLAREDHAAAALLGYHEADQLLTDVSTSARIIAYSLDTTLRRAAQAQRARTLRVGPAPHSDDPARLRALFLSDGEAVLGPGVDPKANPVLLLCAALVAAKNGGEHRPGHPGEPGRALPAPPGAVAVLDAFHVVKVGTQVVDDVPSSTRRVQQDTLSRRGHKDDPLYKIRGLLRHGREHLSEKQVAKLNTCLSAGDPDFEVTLAWHAYQQLRSMYQTPTPTEGKQIAEQVIASFPDCPTAAVTDP